MLRGVMTFFGHPLFTAMIGIGLAVALRSKSKIVRVVAPLAGYTAAAFLHMTFNASASLLQGTGLLLIYLFVAIPLVIGVVVFTVRQVLHEGRLIRTRLIDYVRLGWLPDEDPPALARLRTRGRALWQAIFLGPDVLLATVRMQRSATELAYLRDAMARGIVDAAGSGAGEAPAAQGRTGCAGWRWCSPAPGRRTRRSGGARRSRPHPPTRRPAFPGRPVWVGTTRRPHPAHPAVQHRWGRLLPSTPRSTPPGSRPASELIGPACTGRWDGPDQRRSNRRCDGGSGTRPGDGSGRPAGCPDRRPPAVGAAGFGRAATRRRRPGQAARRLRAAPAGHHRRAAAGRRRRLHRRREVDAGQLAGRPSGLRARGHPADDEGSGARAPRRGRALVHRSRVLPGLARSTGATTDTRSLQLVADNGIPPGLAILDAPDIDSVVADNRKLAAQLLAAADLWLFVTSAARYADAVPWDFLLSAADRSAAVAVVLDRIPPRAMAEVPAHLGRLMGDRGLGGSPLFAVPETDVDDRGTAAGRGHPADPGLAGPAGGRPGQSGRRGPPDPRRSHRRHRPARSRRRGRRGRAASHAGPATRRRRPVVRRGGPHRRGADRGRHPAPRRGAGPLAGVRRHRRVLPRLGAEDRLAARPDHLDVPGRAAGHRRSQGRGRAPGWRRCCATRPTPPPSVRRRPGWPTRPVASCSTGAPRTWVGRRRTSATRRPAPSATGRARCSTWWPTRGWPSGPGPGSWPWG